MNNLMKDLQSSGHNLSYSNNGFMEGAETHSDVDTVMMDDHSVDIGSPMRSCKGRGIPSSVCNPLFPSEGNGNTGAAQYSPIHHRSTPMTPLHKTASTPNSRRLFRDDSVDNSESSLQEMLRKYSPYKGYGDYNARRETLESLDPNESDVSMQSAHEFTVCNSPSRYQGKNRRSSRDGISAPATISRKRASTDRRQLEAPQTPYRRTPSRSNNLFSGPTSAPNTGSSMMLCSPHISPNSFLTMDGRFVQSKNPFSSPMMQRDESEMTPRQAAAAEKTEYEFSAPPFPVAFCSDDDDKNIQQYLPPRRGGRRSILPPSLEHINGGFPDRRFTFTGSPIAESNGMDDGEYSPVRGHDKAQNSMETDLASSGSLHKVRRLCLEDDVVAATGQHIRMSSNNHRNRRPPSIDTGLDSDEDSKSAASGLAFGWQHYDGVSPTDVQNFPHVPPTPIKQKKGPPQPPYARPRSNSPHERNEQITKSRFHGDFDIISELGKGSFGCVYKVLSRLDGCMYAIKAAHRQAKGRADRDRMLKEVYALATLSDQADTATFHIVRYHQAWMEDDRLYIQTELCTGTLMDEIERSGGLTEARKYKLLREILLALAFIHRHNMVHLDIKPENIFLKNDQFKLGDFGLVTMASASQDVEEGDSRYMSMELLSGDRSDLTKSDIFSLGISLYEMCLGQSLPMNGDKWQDLRAGRFDPLPGTSMELAMLIIRMMNPKPEQRPSAAELLKHPKLLSDEQKALIRERDKVVAANLQLQAAQQFHKFPPPTQQLRKKLTRANTWNGTLPNC